MKIALIFDKAREDTMGIYFHRAILQAGHTCEHFWMKDAAGIKEGFDLYLRIDDGDYTKSLPVNLRPSAYWISDTHLEKPLRAIKRQAGNYDYLFCGMKHGTEALSRISKNVFWSPAACDPEVQKRLKVKRDLDIGYVGSDGGIPRKFLLQELRERYLENFIGKAHFSQMSPIYSASKIGFNYVRPRESITMRCMEIMACGAMLLVNRIKDNSPEDLEFKNKESLVYYDTPGELFSLIDYYLAHAQERERIAGAGYKLATSRHTYKHRTEEILSIVKSGT